MQVGEIQKSLPILGGNSVAAGVVVETEFAGNQRGIQRGQFGRAEIALAQQAIDRAGGNFGEEHATRIRPLVLGERHGTLSGGVCDLEVRAGADAGSNATVEL